MKTSFIFISVLLLSATTFAASSPKVKKLNGYPVVFQGKNLKFVSSTGLFKSRIVAHRHTHFFEVAEAYFKCGEKRCTLKNTVSRGFYANCSAKKESYICREKLNTTTSTPTEYEEEEERGQIDDVDNSYSDVDARSGDDVYWDGGESERTGDWETDGIVLF